MRKDGSLVTESLWPANFLGLPTRWTHPHNQSMLTSTTPDGSLFRINRDVSVPRNRAQRIFASGKRRPRFFPKRSTAPFVGTSCPLYFTTRPRGFRLWELRGRDTAANNSEAARESTSSELISVRGCSSKKVLRDRKNEGQAIVIKYFFFSWFSLPQILDHFPEKLVFTKSAFDPDLEFLIPPEVDLIIPKIYF